MSPRAKRAVWIVLGALALVVAGGVLVIAALVVHLLRPAREPARAALTVRGARYVLVGHPMAMGYGPVPFTLEREAGEKRRALPGCEFEVSPKALDGHDELVASPDGALLAVKQAGRYTQLLDVAAQRCLFTDAALESRDGREARSSEISARLGKR